MANSFEDFVAARGVSLVRFAYLLCGDARSRRRKIVF